MKSEIKFQKRHPFLFWLMTPAVVIGKRLFSRKTRNWINVKLLAWSQWKPDYCHDPVESGLNTEPRDVKITVSLTSYPGRINAVSDTCKTLLLQTLKPDRVILWLAESQFPGREKDLPKGLLMLREYGLTLGWCKDIKSYKKLIPALKAYPEDIIVTADDDFFYPPTWLERLYCSYREDRQNIHSHWIMDIGFHDNKLSPYSEWSAGTIRGRVAYNQLLMGGSGALYPPHVLHSDVFKEDVFLRIAPTTDDIWFWAMAVYNGHKIRWVPHALITEDKNFKAANSSALWDVNEDPSTGNDAQLSAILDAYPLIRERLRESEVVEV